MLLFLQLSHLQLVGLEIEQPDLLGTDHGQVDDALSHDEILVGHGLESGDMQQIEFLAGQADGEREFPVEAVVAGGQVLSDFGLPELLQGREVQQIPLWE